MAQEDLPRRMPRYFAAPREASIAFMTRIHPYPPPVTMFHYTSTAALVSIIRNNALWLSDATFLNDKVEITYGKDIARDRLSLALTEEQHLETRAMLESALVKLDKGPDPNIYVACFSLEGDDLAQWRGYGHGEASVAIEIELGTMMFGYASETLLQKVIYENVDQAWTFDEIVRAFQRAYREDIDDPIPDDRREPLPLEKERDICARALYHELWRYIVACKNSAFKSECEVRFSYLAHDFSREGAPFHPVHPAPLFREQRGKIVPFLSSDNLDFQNMRTLQKAPKLPLRTVRIGPVEDQTLIERGVRRLLDAHDHHGVEVTRSGSPYRSS